MKLPGFLFCFEKKEKKNEIKLNEKPHKEANWQIQNAFGHMQSHVFG